MHADANLFFAESTRLSIKTKKSTDFPLKQKTYLKAIEMQKSLQK